MLEGERAARFVDNLPDEGLRPLIVKARHIGYSYALDARQQMKALEPDEVKTPSKTPISYDDITRITYAAMGLPFPGEKKVIEGEVIKAQPHERFALDMPSAKPISFDPMPDHRNPDYMMRGFGYFANPETCTHYRKRMTTATLRWRCADCGEEF
jgi:hypothetical protein